MVDRLTLEKVYMHYPYGRRTIVAIAGLLIAGAGVVNAAPMVSRTAILPVSILGDNDVLIDSQSTANPASTSATSTAATCASVPSTLTGLPAVQPDGCSMPAPTPAKHAFGWQWPLSTSDDATGPRWFRGIIPVGDLALDSFAADDNVNPILSLISATRTDDPSMNLSGWDDVFNVARIGVFQIPLRSDPAERTNILLSAQAVDGVTLQPGEVFSFNDVVGERTANKGYQDGWMFDQGKLIRGTGGGICLVATGLYNVALRSGLGLIERHPHSGLVRYADPGCDAAVVYGSEDLKFENTTGGPLVVRTLVEADRVVVAFFGTPPPLDYQVVVKPKSIAWLPWHTIETPDPTLQPGQTVVVQQPHSGYSVTLERVFKIGNTVISQETVSSDTHRAVDKIVRVPAPAGDDLDQYLSKVLDVDA